MSVCAAASGVFALFAALFIFLWRRAERRAAEYRERLAVARLEHDGELHAYREALRRASDRIRDLGGGEFDGMLLRIAEDGALERP